MANGRVCAKCKLEKEPKDFYSSKPTVCKECVKCAAKARYVPVPAELRKEPGAALRGRKTRRPESLYRVSGVYAIRNAQSGEEYIGSSSSIADRWNTHRTFLRANVHPNARLQALCNEHGVDSFYLEVLERCGRGDLLDREQYWIETRSPALNLNPTAYDSTGRIEPEGIRQRRSERYRAERNPNAKLTAEKVREIRDLIAAGESGPTIAAKFGIKPATVKSIRNGRSWRSV